MTLQLYGKAHTQNKAPGAFLASAAALGWGGVGCLVPLLLLLVPLFWKPLSGDQLSAISFLQQLGDGFLQLAAICFNYVY